MPFDVLHDEDEAEDRIDQELVDLDDVIAVNALEEIRLSAKALDDLFVLEQRRMRALQRDALAGRDAPAEPHFGEGAGSDFAVHGVPAIEDGTLRELSAGRRAHTPVPRITTPTVRAKIQMSSQGDQLRT